MDHIASYNLERWKALAEADAVYTRPAFDLDIESARERVDPDGRLGDVAGKDVLCLASGGGQQSIAFALLGAQATVVDLSPDQLERDARVAAHYGVDIKIVQADMRDLSALPESAFDIVYHSYSLGFVPEVDTVFRQVGRIIREGGIYCFSFANPFFLGTTEQDWNGEGYTLRHQYLEGAEIVYPDQEWVYDRSKTSKSIPGTREFRHTLSSLVSGLVNNGFVVRHISDSNGFDPEPDAQPGTWDHFVSIAPPWLSFWTVYDPVALVPK